MKVINYLAIVLILLLALGCKPGTDASEDNEITGNVVADNQEEKQADKPEQNLDDITGIRVSEWYKSEEHNKDVIDIFNFDDVERTIKVTTLCYDKDGKEIPSDDKEVLKLPSQHQQTWLPMCPEGTESYTIDIEPLD